MKYYEEEFKIKSQPDLTFKYKEQSPIDILAITNDVEMYAGTYNNDIYKKYVNEILENTLVKVNESWVPVKEGNNYLPAYMKDDLKGLREIVDRYFKEVIKPIFLD